MNLSFPTALKRIPPYLIVVVHTPLAKRKSKTYRISFAEALKVFDRKCNYHRACNITLSKKQNSYYAANGLIRLIPAKDWKSLKRLNKTNIFNRVKRLYPCLFACESLDTIYKAMESDLTMQMLIASSNHQTENSKDNECDS